jgi:hypothetical protein
MDDWLIEKVSDHEIKVTTPDSLTVHDGPMTIEDLLYAITVELNKRANNGQVRCGVNCAVGG